MLNTAAYYVSITPYFGVRGIKQHFHEIFIRFDYKLSLNFIETIICAIDPTLNLYSDYGLSFWSYV